MSGSYPYAGEIPPSLSVAQFAGYLKGTSSLMIFDRHADLKYKYGNRHFWCRSYYVDTVGRNAKVIEEYIKNQLQEDIAADQISFKEYLTRLQVTRIRRHKAALAAACESNAIGGPYSMRL